MHSRRVGTPIASGVRIFRPLNEGDSENYAALLRASEGTLGNASVRRVTQGGGDGLLSSPRQYCFSEAMDIRSANLSSCPQVFHSELHSSRRGVTRIVQVRAHARTLRALNSSTSAVIRSPHMSAASRWQKALPAPSHF